MIYIVMTVMLIIYVGSVMIYQNYSKRKNGGVECKVSGCVSCVAANSCSSRQQNTLEKVK